MNAGGSARASRILRRVMTRDASRRSTRLPAAAIALAVAAACAGRTDAAAFEASIGFERVEGEFGSDENRRFDQMFVQTKFGGAGSRLLVRLPYLRVDRTGNVTTTADGPIVLGRGGPGRPAWQESDAGEGESGIGDVYLRSDTFLSRAGQGKRPALAFVLDLKWPTADEKSGLGTGEMDWGAGLDYVQPLGKVVQILGVAHYRFMGSPEGVVFDDRLRLSVGLAFVSAHATWRIVGENSPPVLDQVPLLDAAGMPAGFLDVEDYRTARGEVVIRSGDGGSTRIYALTGLNDSSPNLGFGIVLSSGPQ